MDSMTAIYEGAGIARVVERAQRPGVMQRAPDQLALVGAGRQPAGKEQTPFTEAADSGGRRAGAPEGFEKRAQRALHLKVGVEHDFADRVVYEADWQSHLQLAPTRLRPLSADESCPQDVKLGLAHGAL